MASKIAIGRVSRNNTQAACVQCANQMHGRCEQSACDTHVRTRCTQHAYSVRHAYTMRTTFIEHAYKKHTRTHAAYNTHTRRMQNGEKMHAMCVCVCNTMQTDRTHDARNTHARCIQHTRNKCATCVRDAYELRAYNMRTVCIQGAYNIHGNQLRLSGRVLTLHIEPGELQRWTIAPFEKW